MTQTVDDADYVFQRLDENRYEWQRLTDGCCASVERLHPESGGWHYSVECTAKNKRFRGYKPTREDAMLEAGFWLRQL